MVLWSKLGSRKVYASEAEHQLEMGSGSSVAHDLTGEQKVALTKLIEEKYLTLQKEQHEEIEIFQTLKL
jgi:hypothetical protein